MISAEQQKRVDDLARRIAVEKDYGKNAKLARELNELLAAKYLPPAGDPKNRSSSVHRAPSAKNP